MELRLSVFEEVAKVIGRRWLGRGSCHPKFVRLRIRSCKTFTTVAGRGGGVDFPCERSEGAPAVGNARRDRTEFDRDPELEHASPWRARDSFRRGIPEGRPRAVRNLTLSRSTG